MTHPVKSVAGTHFTTAIAPSNVETETSLGIRGDGKGCISAITIRSKENLAWQVEVYDANDTPLVYPFEAPDATESGDYFYYSATDLDWPIPLTIPYETVTIGIRNMSGTAKTAGTAGELVVTLVLKK